MEAVSVTPEIFCLCEAASVKHGQTCILHTFANWGVSSNPGSLMGVLVAQVRFMDDENGDHQVECVMRDADGLLVWRSGARGWHIQVNGGCAGAMSLFPLQAEVSHGQHEIALVIDGREISTLLLAVIFNQLSIPPKIS